jgi:hypothetical protein
VFSWSADRQGDQTGVEDGVQTGVAEFEHAALTLGVHRPELLGRHRVHPHPAGMEGERLRVPAEQPGHLGLDGHVGAGEDQADPEGCGHRGTFRFDDDD